MVDRTLPDGWEWKTIGDLYSVIGGGTLSKPLIRNIGTVIFHGLQAQRYCRLARYTIAKAHY